jgi:hypothetical protein
MPHAVGPFGQVTHIPVAVELDGLLGLRVVLVRRRVVAGRGLGRQGLDGRIRVRRVGLETPILTVGLSAEVLDAGFSSVAWLTKVARGGVTKGTGGRLATNVGTGLAAGSGAALATGWGCDVAPPGAGASR